MDQERFDDLTRWLAAGATRRRMIGGGIGMVATVLAAAAGDVAGKAKRRRKGRDQEPGGACIPSGKRCSERDNGDRACASACCSGLGDGGRCVCRREDEACETSENCCAGTCVGGYCSASGQERCLPLRSACKGTGKPCCAGMVCASGQGGRKDVACYRVHKSPCAGTDECHYGLECREGLCREPKPVEGVGVPCSAASQQQCATPGAVCTPYDPNHAPAGSFCSMPVGMTCQGDPDCTCYRCWYPNPGAGGSASARRGRAGRAADKACCRPAGQECAEDPDCCLGVPCLDGICGGRSMPAGWDCPADRVCVRNSVCCPDGELCDKQGNDNCCDPNVKRLVGGPCAQDRDCCSDYCDPVTGACAVICPPRRVCPTAPTAVDGCCAFDEACDLKLGAGGTCCPEEKLLVDEPCGSDNQCCSGVCGGTTSAKTCSATCAAAGRVACKVNVNGPSGGQQDVCCRDGEVCEDNECMPPCPKDTHERCGTNCCESSQFTCNQARGQCESRVQPCSQGETVCGATCVNTKSDANHCGGCNIMCTGGKTCTNGSCKCPQGQTDCGGTCTALDTTSSCGTCGNACAVGASCTNGGCKCPQGQTDCGGTCKALDTNTDCGTCGNACTGGMACCGDTCKALTTTSNCGVCGNKCGNNEICNNGTTCCRAKDTNCTSNGQCCSGTCSGSGNNKKCT